MNIWGNNSKNTLVITITKYPYPYDNHNYVYKFLGNALRFLAIYS